MQKKIWLVEHPTWQYNEDVQELAAKNMLQIIDSNFADNYSKEQLVSEKEAPKLTKKK